MIKNLLRVVVFLLFSFAFSYPYSSSTEVSRPNIIFIMSDDHTSQAWGIYGGILADFVKNDNIKRLATEGMTLDNVFCTNSICTPSRASIMTGQYSHQNGVYTLSEALEPDSMNIAKALQHAGYQTAIIGKWHLKKQPSGFDHFNVLPGQGRYHDPILKTKDNWEDGGKVYQGFSADVIGDLSLQWLQQRDREEPFFMMTHFKATHEPFDYPARHHSLLAEEELPEPSSLYDFGPSYSGRSFDGQQLWRLGQRWVSDTEKVKNGKKAFYPGLPFSLEGLDSLEARKKIYQKFVKDFIRSGAAIDDNIGKILDYLDEAGLADNTIVIYTADQGYFLGEHGFFDKRMIYEQALRMPFVVRYPKEIAAGARNNDMILNLDFPSLFADYAQAQLPHSFQGRSFRENLTGQTPADWREQMYYRYWLHQTNRPAHFGIRNERYKLAFFYGQALDMPGSHGEATSPTWEFFDLQEDPEEIRNAYGDPKYEGIIREMKAALQQLRSEVGDTDTGDALMQSIFEASWE
ncbi:MAG: sulfatase [Saprospiraceae bacterium]|nr:sulfatase [Saprospiraceae bacterium]